MRDYRTYLACLINLVRREIVLEQVQRVMSSRELKSWMRNIITSHEQRLQNGLRFFVFSKLLTHTSESYSPTLLQISHNRLLFTIANKIRLGPFFLTPCAFTCLQRIIIFITK